MPRLPLVLHFGSQSVEVVGLVDSASTVNVLPYQVGIRLGATWDDRKATIRLAGMLGNLNAMPLFVTAQVGQFAPVRLAFAWIKSNDVPLILGQTNFLWSSMFASTVPNLNLRSSPSQGESAVS